MATILSDQAFYALTLEQSSHPTAATVCRIANSAPREQQLVECIGQRVTIREMRKTNNEDPEVLLTTLIDVNVFGIVRAVVTLRIPGTDQDQIVVATDSGRVVCLTYNADKKTLDPTFLETFGKSGIRRNVPGQYLAAEPKGRCFMLASMEKSKIVFLLQRQPGGGLSISSPKEANQFGTLCYSLCALHTGWEHPVFAALEADHIKIAQDQERARDNDTEAAQPQLMLTYYTVEINLASVVKSWSVGVDPTASMLFGVPGSEHGGPSGVLVCCKGSVSWYHENYIPMRIMIPIRKDVASRTTIGVDVPVEHRHRIVAGCSHAMKGGQFFFLLQTDQGDTWKLTMEMEVDEVGRSTGQVVQMTWKYYETFPVARSMVIFRRGYLYIAAENGSSKLYNIDSLADDEDMDPRDIFVKHIDEPMHPTLGAFEPRRDLQFTTLLVDVPALHPLIKTRVDNLTGEDAPQIYALQGRDQHSSFKTIRHGLEISPIVKNPVGEDVIDGLWSLKAEVSDTIHSYLIMSSSWAERTIVLRITDSVETVDDTAFLLTRCTIFAQLMGQDTLVQVHPKAVRQIRSSGQVVDWPSPKNRSIVVAAGNGNQLLLGLSSGELAFFFYGEDDSLSQMEDMPEMNGKITAVAVAKLPKGMAQAKYAAVGCDDQTIRIFNITVDKPLEQRSVQALSAVPTSIEIQEIGEDSGSGTIQVVHIGLASGLYLRAVIDEATGELGDVRTKFLGPRPTRLFSVEVNNKDCLLAASTRPWLGYNHSQTSMYTLTPLISAQLETVVSFLSEEIKGLCAIQGTNLLIFTVNSLDGRLATTTIPLTYTPRAFDRNPYFPIFYVAQSSGETLNLEEREFVVKADPTPMQVDGETNLDLAALTNSDLFHGKGHWASCISVLDTTEDAGILQTFEFASSEAALCCVCVTFESRDWEVFLAVGTEQGQQLTNDPSIDPTGAVHIFRILEDGSRLEWVHQTEFNYPVRALLPYKGRLAIGAGNELFIHDMGMKALLRKSRATVVQNQIVSLDAMGERIICGDISDGVTYVVFKQEYNRLIPFVDDTIQRWLTTTTMIDYETTAGGDKFGNLWVVRPPKQASDESDEDGAGGYIHNERSYLGGAPYRLDLKAHYYCQDIPMSLQRTALVAGGQEVLFWAGLQGTLGMLVPFVAREDLDFFTQLESQLRTQKEAKPLAGRDHMAFRSYYVPVKGIIDGDLCEQFFTLHRSLKEVIAAELDRSVKDIEKKVGEMRTRVAF